MNFTISTVAKSLADYLTPYFPDVTFYEDPNQQDSKPPCLFLQQRYANTQKYPAGRYLRKIGLDLTYLAEYNRPDLQQIYQAAAETLDEVMETFPYSDGEKSGLLRTYDRDWRIDLDALHYKFELQVFVKLPDSGIPMESIDSAEITIKKEG